MPANLELQEYEYDTPLAMQDKGSSAGKMFYTRIGDALAEVDDRYDVVVVDCPPQLGYLTLTALTAATSVLITVHPQMLDIMSHEPVPADARRNPEVDQGGRCEGSLNWFRYLVTRFEPTDIPQAQMVGFMQSMFAKQMLKNHMLKSTAISDAGLTKQTLYEVERIPVHSIDLRSRDGMLELPSTARLPLSSTKHGDVDNDRSVVSRTDRGFSSTMTMTCFDFRRS